MMTHILRMKCEDQAGIVSGLGQVLDRFGCNIGQSFQFLQPASIREDDVAEIFFLRLEFTCTEQTDWSELEQELEALRSCFDADLSVRESGRAVPTILMVSKFDHCLIDILYRVQTGKLPLDIVAVVSNHAHSRADVERLGIPYYLWPVTKENKQEQEQKLEELIERSGAELVVLARYMQILSDEFSSRHFGKIINIHHSFLPAFKGAMPYKRAWERGVKHIGATAHYVTPNLDEGPIIEQDTERVSHSDSASDLVRLGGDVEARVLSKALRLHIEGRVFINGNRTIVFKG
ncbi:formyltetrahydrofolate deformylase [Cohaesibacter gelatinilyticus]